jgi:hypothetical protein
MRLLPILPTFPTNPTALNDEVWIGMTRPKQIVVFSREEFLENPSRVIDEVARYGCAIVVDGDKALMTIGTALPDDWICAATTEIKI